MTPIFYLGFLVLVFTSLLGHAVILVAAYKSARRFIDMAAKGECRHWQSTHHDSGFDRLIRDLEEDRKR